MDYVRFHVLYNYGGVYLDTDVELLKPLDNLLKLGNFMGIEENITSYGEIKYMINTGVGMAFEKHNPIINDILNIYQNKHFYNRGGSISKETVVTVVTNMFKKNRIFR